MAAPLSCRLTVMPSYLPLPVPRSATLYWAVPLPLPFLEELMRESEETDERTNLTIVTYFV